MGVLKVVLPVLGMVQIVLAFLYADTGFQAGVRYHYRCTPSTTVAFTHREYFGFVFRTCQAPLNRIVFLIANGRALHYGQWSVSRKLPRVSFHRKWRHATQRGASPTAVGIVIFAVEFTPCASPQSSPG